MEICNKTECTFYKIDSYYQNNCGYNAVFDDCSIRLGKQNVPIGSADVKPLLIADSERDRIENIIYTALMKESYDVTQGYMSLYGVTREDFKEVSKAIYNALTSQ